jgi:hypothetical protein
MKKLTITAALLASLLFGAKAQDELDKPVDTTYEKRKLKVDEINFVNSYYNQTGNKAAVTGGKGDEALTDFANSIDLKMSKYDSKNRLHTFNVDFNIDYYTSASQANIDLNSPYMSSASKEDVHIYPSVSWNVKNEKTGVTKGINYAYSTEWDYHSNGLNLNWSKSSNNNNTEIGFKVGAFLDKYDVILPAELRPNRTGGGRNRGPLEVKPRNTYNFSASISQIVNERLQLMLVTEPSFQEGLLSTPFNRIYFTDGTEYVEKLPGKRFKLPIGFRANYFFGDNLILRSFYRFYTDSWGMTANTVNLEAAYKFTPFFSISPFYRFNTQTAVKYFEVYGKHDITKPYHTSDYDISAFDSHFVGAGFRFSPPNGLFGVKGINSSEIRFGHYLRNNGLVANMLTLNIKVK